MRGHGFAHHSFWIKKEFCIQLITFLQTLKYARPDKLMQCREINVENVMQRPFVPHSTLELSIIAMLVFHISFKFPKYCFYEMVTVNTPK